MVETGTLKGRARKKLAGNWWTPILVMLFVTVGGLVANIVTGVVSEIVLSPYVERFLAYWLEILDSIAADITPSDTVYLGLVEELRNIQLISPIIQSITLIGQVFEWIFMLPAVLFFLNIVEGEPSKFSDFKSGWKRLGESLRLYFLMSLKIFLWSLLFIIPGIVKTFSYALAPIIKAKNPSRTAGECIAESCRLMNGNKGNLFILELTFIGWYILVALASRGAGSIPAVGTYLSAVVSYVASAVLQVYVQMTEIEFYQEVVHPSRFYLRGKAVERPNVDVFEELTPSSQTPPQPFTEPSNPEPFEELRDPEPFEKLNDPQPSTPSGEPQENDRPPQDGTGTQYAGQQQKERNDDR